MRESSSKVIVNGTVRRLETASPLVRTLRKAQLNQWRLGVYAPAEMTDAVGPAAARRLGLEIDGGLVTDVSSGVYATLDRFEDSGGADHV